MNIPKRQPDMNKMKFITELTNEQIAKFKDYVDKWTKIGLSIERADRQRIYSGLKELYALAKIPWHNNCIFVNSPIIYSLVGPLANKLLISSSVSSAMYSALLSAMDSSVVSSIRSAFLSAVDLAVVSEIYLDVSSAVDLAFYSALRSTVGQQWELYLGGQFWAGFISYYSYMYEVLKIKGCSNIRSYQKIADGGWILPSRQFAICCDSPTEIHLNNNQLHNNHGPAINWADEWKLFYLNGCLVPEWLVMLKDTEINPAKITELDNAEQRREFVRKIGYERIYYKLGGEILDKKELLISNGIEIFRHPYEVIRLKIGNGWTFLKMLNPSLSTPDNPVWHLEGRPNECNTVDKALHYQKPDWFKKYPVSKNGADWYQDGDVFIVPEKVCAVKAQPINLT